MLILKTFLSRRNSYDDSTDFPHKEEKWLYGPFLKRRNKSWTLLTKEKQVKDTDTLQNGRTSRRYGPSSERRNKSKIWTLLEKEE